MVQLYHYQPDATLYLETDASDFAIGVVLSQKNDNDIHPIAFWSRKMTPAERNYPIYDKELLAIIASLQHWRHYCLHAIKSTIISSDHQSLQWFNSTKALSRRQIRWSQILSEYNFQIKYNAGKKSSSFGLLIKKARLLGKAYKENIYPSTRSTFCGNKLNIHISRHESKIRNTFR